MKKGIMIMLAIIVLLPIVYFIAPALFAILLLAGMIMLKIKYPAMKGAVGEWYVNRILSKLGTNYRVFHDLYVPNGQGGTSQVDHVVTSPFGIFVIETKHYQGWIFGKENQKYWTQTIYKRKEKLFNPIWQNYGHIQAIRKYIDKEDFEAIHSIIAFSQQSTLKFNENFKSARVIQFSQLIKAIKEWNVRRISDSELRNINQALEGLLVNDKKEKKIIKKKHVVNISNNRKEQVRKQKENNLSNRCPKCGGELSRKNGKYGSFYGCSNFPKCRYTKQAS